MRFSRRLFMIMSIIHSSIYTPPARTPTRTQRICTTPLPPIIIMFPRNDTSFLQSHVIAFHLQVFHPSICQSTHGLSHLFFLFVCLFIFSTLLLSYLIWALGMDFLLLLLAVAVWTKHMGYGLTSGCFTFFPCFLFVQSVLGYSYRCGVLDM